MPYFTSNLREEYFYQSTGRIVIVFVIFTFHFDDVLRLKLKAKLESILLGLSKTALCLAAMQLNSFSFQACSLRNSMFWKVAILNCSWIFPRGNVMLDDSNCQTKLQSMLGILLFLCKTDLTVESFSLKYSRWNATAIVMTTEKTPHARTNDKILTVATDSSVPRFIARDWTQIKANVPSGFVSLRWRPACKK